MDERSCCKDDIIMTFSDEFYDEYSLLEACLEYDFEAVQNILDDAPTDEELNERDQSGKVGYRGLLLSTLPIDVRRTIGGGVHVHWK